MKTTGVLKRPILTEKSLRLAQQGQYTFEVNKQATKRKIVQAVQSQFEVDVIAVRTISIKGKKRRVGKLRRKVEKSSWKKAMVTLKAGQKIALFDVG